MIDLDDLLKPDPSAVKEVRLPRGTVYMRPLASCVKDRISGKFQMYASKPEMMEGLTAEIIAGCLCDKDGSRLDLSDAQMNSLRRLDCDLTDQLFAIAQKLSGLSDDAVEGAEKN